MKNVFLILGLFIHFSSVSAQNKDPWRKYMTPSGMHSLLSNYSGAFSMEITMSPGEGKEPMIVKLSSAHNMLLGGRFLEMKQQGIMMGMDYQSIFTMGYNNTDNKFALTTITNMGTGTLSLFGEWDEKSKSATLFGNLTNPVNMKVIKVRQVVTFIDGDTILIKSYDKEDDEIEKKTVEYKLVRNN